MHPVEKAFAEIVQNLAGKNRRIQHLEAEVERLRATLREAADMTEHETDRTLIFNHLMDAVEAAH